MRHTKLLLPGPWFWLTVAGWWAFRFAGLIAMRAFGGLPLHPGHLAQGLLFDGLLVYALFSPATAAAALGQTSHRGRARLASAVFLVLATGVALLRLVDTAACWFGLAHLTEGMWQHIAPGSLGYALTWEFAGAMAGLAAIVAALNWAAARDSRHRLRRLEPGAADGRPVLAALLAGGLALAPPVLAPLVQRQHAHHWGLVPEINAVGTLWGTLRAGDRAGDPASARVPQLNDATVRALREAGLLAPGQDPSAPWPLLRRGFGDNDALALDPAAAARGLSPIAPWLEHKVGRPPNLLLVLVESLSTAFTPLDPRSDHQDVMPGLAAFAADNTLVHGYVNVTSPTANGLIASLCATLPPSAVQEIEVGGSVDSGAAYRCISDILQGFGYRTLFARGASKVYMACEATLRAHGFDRVEGREDLSGPFADRPTNSWGYYDDTLVDHLIARIDQLEGQTQPWMLATLTLGSHLPGYPDPSCQVPAPLARSRLLGGFHCSDRQLTRLIAHLKASGAWDHTLVVITGDHAELPTREVEALVSNEALFGAFAPMPLLIHDPLHRLPRRVQVHSGQLDLAPTLLHLLGAPEVEHSMLGYSIFGQRRRHPLIVGRIGSRMAYASTPTARRELPLGVLHELCAAGEPLLPGVPGALGPCELDAWFDWLDGLWRAHRLYPADRYRGSSDPAAHLSRLKWLRYDAKEERVRREQGVQERRPAPGQSAPAPGE